MEAIKMEPRPAIEVPKPITAVQVQSFIDDGYLVVPGLIEAAELAELKGDLVDVARGRYECDNIEPVDPTLSDQAVLESILCIHQPHYVSPVIEEYVRHPKICGALSQITAAHLPFWDGSVKCMQSMYFVKPPNFQGQAWHQDEIYIPTRDRSLIGAWIAVDDATVETAACTSFRGRTGPGTSTRSGPTKTRTNSTSRPRATALTRASRSRLKWRPVPSCSSTATSSTTRTRTAATPIAASWSTTTATLGACCPGALKRASHRLKPIGATSCLWPASTPTLGRAIKRQPSPWGCGTARPSTRSTPPVRNTHENRLLYLGDGEDARHPDQPPTKRVG